MLEPTLFLLLMVTAVGVTYLMKELLCKLLPPFRRLMDKLDAVPEEEKHKKPSLWGRGRERSNRMNCRSGLW